MDQITFNVNGRKCSVGSDVDSDMSLNDYLRNRLNLRGTKYMCKEGGCGACIVAVTVPEINSGLPRTFSVNSCLVSITSCQNWSIKTIEGIGSRWTGYHPIQKTLAQYNGTQCGYCSPGWVMSMYSLLESKQNGLTEEEIENSFGSNICRCTGNRPILDAFKSFAHKESKSEDIIDIEDILHICKHKEGNCKKSCPKNNIWCVVEKDEMIDIKAKKIKLKDDRVWYRVLEIKDIFDILHFEGYESYMLVNGNTGRGAYPIFAFPRVLIDISAIKSLRENTFDQNLIMGAGTTITDMMTLFKAVAKEHEEFSYLNILNEHLDLVAHIPVKNIGSVAGNLMVKHNHNEFSSDLFLLFETVGATMTIVDKYGATLNVTPEEFLDIDMTGKLIVNIKLPPLSKHYRLVTYKIMPRYQNAHAQTNAGFLYMLDSHNSETVISARIVFGGLSAEFVHARNTERYLVGCKLFSNDVLQKALSILKHELIVKHIPGEPSTEFRKQLALGLFYKGLLSICSERVNEKYKSGARDIRKTRPVSKSKQVFDTNPTLWPINEPTPKIEALIQCAGEALYVNDLPTLPEEVFAAFATSTIATGELGTIDATHALNCPGVIAFYTAKDIPGINSYISQTADSTSAPVEVLCNGIVKYYGQPLGIIVAKSEEIANRAVCLVDVKYKNKKQPPILNIDDAMKDPSRISQYYTYPASDRGSKIQKIIKGKNNINGQYHYTMEAQSSVTKPTEDGFDIFTSTQWIDGSLIGVAEALKVDEKSINIKVPRVGGAYGAKIYRSIQVAVASSLVTKLTGRPCRFIMSIKSNMTVMGKRPPSQSNFEVGVNINGEIQYLNYHILDDVGYVFSEDILLPGSTVRTDNSPNTYARGPGTFEFISMTEYIMEQISYELNLDPITVRKDNISKDNLNILEIIDTIVKESNYYKRKKEVEEFNNMNRWKKRGIRAAFMSWPIPLLSYYNVVLAVYHGNGDVVIKHGGIEMGQGINTKVRQVCAYVLEIPLEKIVIKPADSFSNPNNGYSAGSQTTESVCFATAKACQLLIDRLEPVRKILNNPTWETLVKEAYLRGINLQTSYLTNNNDREPYRIEGATIAEVELDILTGEHEIRRIDLLEDAGLSTNPEIDIGQIEGAFIMGVGFWTSEHLSYDKRSGELLTNRTWNYFVPQAKDIPIDFRVTLRKKSFNDKGFLGAKSCGEPAICMSVAVAFALRQAITSSRENSGRSGCEWFPINGQYTTENMVLAADVSKDEFIFY